MHACLLEQPEEESCLILWTSRYAVHTNCLEEGLIKAVLGKTGSQSLCGVGKPLVPMKVLITQRNTNRQL